MAHKSVFISGFGPFEKVTDNSSGALAAALEADPPPGVQVQSQLLPVSFDRSAEVLGEALSGRKPGLLVGLGEQPRDGFRLELRAARGSAESTRPDVDGVPAGRSGWRLEPGGRWREDLWTPLEQPLTRFVQGRCGWMRSAVAGGYVCERVFRWLLEAGAQRGVPALFVHLPPLAACARELQLRELQGLLLELDF